MSYLILLMALPVLDLRLLSTFLNYPGICWAYAHYHEF
jgi:hypothetical protein